MGVSSPFTVVWEAITQTSESPPWLLSYRSSSVFISATVSIAVFTDIFLYAIIVPVIPFSLQVRAGVDADSVQSWVSILIAVYGASLLAFSPICGWFADHSNSRRVPLLLGLFALAGATVMLHVGRSIGLLVAGRLLQGASAAVVWVVGLALLVDTVGKEDVGQAMGYVSIAMSLGILVAPLLGGVVLDKGGYTAVFAMAYGLIGLDIILRLVLVEKKIARRWEPQEEVVDLADTRTHGYGTTPTSREGEADKEKPSTDMPPPSRDQTDSEKVDFSESPTPAPAEAQPPANQPSSRYNLPPTLSLLTSKRLAASLWSTLAVSILFASFDATLPLFVRTTFHWNSTGAGLIFLPIVVPTFTAPAIGWLSDRYGPRWCTACGFLGCCPFYVLLRLVTHDSLEQKVLLCALLALLAASVTFIMPCIMAEITYVVAAKEERQPGLFGAKGAYAQAYGLFNMAWAGGSLAGPLWAGYVRDEAGWGTMTWSFGLLAAISAVPAVLFCGGWIGNAKVKGGVGDAGDGETGVEEKRKE
ncbi:uncharacterized protein K452DRAFT_231426 [Aplosporella prunicola CBS 121167]|uniref:Major facilitator superfamily (MFS) profile domain-containing protein n=1 Tax=Aplosporella prunicola CBS 121167 TaxID=1176127 RepID=A0A6A6BC42_9PEZI|nr:uncharacterized protein K452DRAFT_231426 [Aplosporella prunicola CBS 121167]KAF2140031.1 hypothetical protein K452DRAFT_231426 [Aplosporella prunicola CBS 121167]